MKSCKIRLEKKENYSDNREVVYLSKSLQRKLQTLSKKTGRSKSEFVRLALDHYFDNVTVNYIKW